MFREGAQLSEAILFLEEALRDKKVDGELAQKVTSYLDRRSEIFIRDWYERGSAFINRWSIAGQFERDARLLELSAEVAAASGR